MNRIKTSDVLDPSIQQPFTARSLDFLQDSNKDMVKGIVLSLIGSIYDASKYYIISGLQGYGTNQISEGYVFFNGELYYCAGKTSTTAIANTLVLTIDTTTSINSPYDPVRFTDNIERAVHLLRRFVMTDAVSGTGTVDYSSCINVNIRTFFSPTLKAYDGSGAEVVGGFSASSFEMLQYTLNSTGLRVDFKSLFITIGAGVRKLSVSEPIALPSTGAGTSVGRFNQTISAGITVSVDYSASGNAVIIEKTDRTDFPAVAGTAELSFSIIIGF